MCSNAVPSSSQRERTRQRGGMDFDSMTIFYLIPILEIVEKTPSRGLYPTSLGWPENGYYFFVN